MDEQEIERLLYSGESEVLDFKRDQYPLTDKNKKSELIKDIVAFANSWRTTDAYILIGVDEIKVAGRSTVVGITTHLQDSDIQQLVNSKTNRKVSFLYEPMSFKGLEIGVIKIPVQERPTVLTANFGGLLKETVYVRRGSSTDTAGATELLNMTRAPSAPSFTVEFANIAARQRLGPIVTLKSTIVKYEADKIPRMKTAPYSMANILGRGNEGHYREHARYIAEVDLLNEVGFYVQNEGAMLAPNVRLVIEGTVEPEVTIGDGSQYPKYPGGLDHGLSYLDKVDVEIHGNQWSLTVQFGNIQPKASAWSFGSFHIGATKNTKLDLSAVIYADNVSDPVIIPLTINIEVAERKLELTELEIQED
jgi:hypothetical protein